MTDLYLQSFQQLLSRGNVGHVDGGAEGMKHLHFLKDIFAAGGPNDEKLAALVPRERCVTVQIERPTRRLEEA